MFVCGCEFTLSNGDVCDNYLYGNPYGELIGTPDITDKSLIFILLMKGCRIEVEILFAVFEQKDWNGLPDNC